MSGGRKSAPPSIAEIAPHFPELEILELIGAGGMGAVYKARQPQLDRFVALKILSHDLAGDPSFVERFNREARVLARLSHPNIVGIHDFGTAGPYCFLTMELVDGVNLRQAMQAGRFTPTEALEMVQHLCSALKFAHEEGILHRDIKPENILIDSKGRVKIADFGIAKLVGDDREQDFTLTLQGSVLGSPHYMAPEQIETPGDVDQRADIYSLGVVLYEMLTGGLPLGRFALPSEKAEMDARIDHIVMRTLEKERDARYQSAGEVSTEVEALGKSPAPPSIKAAALPAEPVAARFSLAATILTGISIPLAIIVFVALTSRLQGPPESVKYLEPVEHVVEAILPLLSALATLCCAFLGFILGACALGEIRRSGGVKTGLGRAVFATVAWPILLLLFDLAWLFLQIPSSGEDPSLEPVALILVILVPVLLAAWMLVRSLYRWAGGVEGKNGTRSHPGLGMPLLAMIIFALIESLLIAQLAKRYLPASEGRHAQQSAQDVAAIAALSDHEDWRRSKPEVLIPITTQPGQRATLRLLLKDGDGNARAFRLGDFRAEPNHPRQYGVLQVGTRLSGTAHLMSVVFIANQRSSGANRTDVDLRGWEFDENLPDELTFASIGQYEFQLATLRKDGQDTPTGILTLEVVVTPPSAVEKLIDSRKP
jgi:tRNA A-37 threonylcarbamoyl transferase component Bud32